MWTIFTPPLPFLNIFMIRVSLPRVQFYQAGVVSYPLLKKSQEWAKGRERGEYALCEGPSLSGAAVGR